MAEGHIITGSQSLLKAMTIPFTNQIFLGGRFNDDLSLGELNLSSIESNNVYITYLKDDTWLNTMQVEPNNLPISPNPFVQSFKIEPNLHYKSVEVFDFRGVLLEVYSGDNIPENIGVSWKSGVYMLRLVSEDGQASISKVVKIY